VSKPQFRKNKIHGLANAPPFKWGGDCRPGFEEGEVLARKERTAVTPEAEGEDLLVLESPPGLAGVSGRCN